MPFIMSISEKMAISELDVAAFIKHKDLKLVGDRLITIPKKREKGFLHIGMNDFKYAKYILVNIILTAPGLRPQTPVRRRRWRGLI
ncbi:MAG: hypothetical protein FIB07_06365 [Candidatus Methanoperedens sp.]|nr:hypothetical protein [Candidatus Methanoperedens sp.]